MSGNFVPEAKCPEMGCMVGCYLHGVAVDCRVPRRTPQDSEDDHDSTFLEILNVYGCCVSAKDAAGHALVSTQAV